MKLLSICIPNYDRIEKLERLIRESAAQITNRALESQVQICISDDCSPENPKGRIKKIQEEYPQVEIRFRRNKENRGMDYNFLNSVIMASSVYCWIIGNDDLPTENGVDRAVHILAVKQDIDIICTPFDIYSDDGAVRQTIYPLSENEEKLFDTAIPEQYSELLLSVRHNSGLFGFLSNVIFKRSKWMEYQTQFKDKMNSIFIQIYMNIETLKNGAGYLYSPEKIIKNYADDETNESVDRICKILFGLNDVVDFFFEGAEKEHLKRVMVDAYISGKVWELSDAALYKEKVKAVCSPKNQLYKTYFIPTEARRKLFSEKKVILYGAGEYGRKVYKELKEYGADMIGVADSADSKTGLPFGDFRILSVSEMTQLYRDQKPYVLVANHFYLEEMIDTLLKNGIERIGIIS